MCLYVLPKPENLGLFKLVWLPWYTLPHHAREVSVFDFMKSYSGVIRCLMSLFAM